MALQNDEHSRTWLSCREQQITARISALRAESCDTLQVVFAELREHVVAALLERKSLRRIVRWSRARGVHGIGFLTQSSRRAVPFAESTCCFIAAFITPGRVYSSSCAVGGQAD